MSESSGQQAGKLSTYEAMQFSIVLVKYGKAFTEKYVIWMEAYVALKHILYIPFSIYTFRH